VGAAAVETRLGRVARARTPRRDGRRCCEDGITIGSAAAEASPDELGPSRTGRRFDRRATRGPSATTAIAASPRPGQRPHFFGGLPLDVTAAGHNHQGASDPRRHGSRWGRCGDALRSGTQSTWSRATLRRREGRASAADRDWSALPANVGIGKMCAEVAQIPRRPSTASPPHDRGLGRRSVRPASADAVCARRPRPRPSRANGGRRPQPPFNSRVPEPAQASTNDSRAAKIFGS